LGVAFVDRDAFREVNDMFGHANGDDALIAVGDRLKRSVRTEDLVARFGDEPARPCRLWAHGAHARQWYWYFYHRMSVA